MKQYGLQPWRYVEARPQRCSRTPAAERLRRSAQPSNPTGAASLLWRKGETRTARIEFLNAIELDPDNARFRFAQARDLLAAR